MPHYSDVIKINCSIFCRRKIVPCNDGRSWRKIVHFSCNDGRGIVDDAYGAHIIQCTFYVITSLYETKGKEKISSYQMRENIVISCFRKEMSFSWFVPQSKRKIPLLTYVKYFGSYKITTMPSLWDFIHYLSWFKDLLKLCGQWIC